MPGINSRRKGANNERDIAKLFETWTHRKFAKTPASGGLQWQSSNSKGDIVCTTEGHYFPFCIEAKVYHDINFAQLLIPMRITKKSPNPICKILEFWNQCKRDALKARKVPILFMRYNGMPSDFHIIVIERDFHKAIWPGIDFRSNRLQWQNPLKKLSLTLMVSPDFFKLKYKEVKPIAKQYIMQLYGKKIKTKPNTRS